MEKGMATHASILAWKIPWTEELGGLQSMASQRAGHNWAIKPPYVNPESEHIQTEDILFIVVVVQRLSCVWLFATLRTLAIQASLSFIYN